MRPLSTSGWFKSFLWLFVIALCLGVFRIKFFMLQVVLNSWIFLPLTCHCFLLLFFCFSSVLSIVWLLLIFLPTPPCSCHLLVHSQHPLLDSFPLPGLDLLLLHPASALPRLFIEISVCNVVSIPILWSTTASSSVLPEGHSLCR